MSNQCSCYRTSLTLFSHPRFKVRILSNPQRTKSYNFLQISPKMNLRETKNPNTNQHYSLQILSGSLLSIRLKKDNFPAYKGSFKLIVSNRRHRPLTKIIPAANTWLRTICKTENWTFLTSNVSSTSEANHLSFASPNKFSKLKTHFFLPKFI